MIRVIYLFIIILFAASCHQKKHGLFTVTGEIKNAPSKKIFLMETPYTNEQPLILDSAFLQAKGAFTLKGRANEESIYRLVLENGPDVILINDNDAINVHLDVNNYRHYVIENSPASENLHQLFEDYRAKDSAIITCFKQIDSLHNIPGKDSISEVLKTGNDKRVEELNALLDNFIKTNNSPSAVLYALGIASQTIKQDEMKIMVNAAAARFPQHPGLARVKTMIALKKPAEKKPEEAPYALLNKQAPNLTMPGTDGKNISISDFKGKYLLLDFWASWCGPCRQENPNVVAAYNQFKNKNFTILGISLDQEKQAWLSAIAKDNLTWNHMSDLKQWESVAVQTYNFEGIPFNVLVDPQGKIIASKLFGQQLEKKLEEVLR